MKQKAFTLIELLVVIFIIALLLAVLAPSARNIFRLSQRNICSSNVHQLSLGWASYLSNSQGKLVGGSTGTGQWVDTGDNAQAAMNGLIYQYTQEVSIYHCPSDSVHWRTYSVCASMNGERWDGIPFAETSTTIKDIGWQMVFVEENDNRGYNVGSWIVEPKECNRNRWVDYVANFHDKGDNVGFADGHAEYWRWIDDRTIYASKNFIFFYPDDANPDLEKVRSAYFCGQ